MLQPRARILGSRNQGFSGSDSSIRPNNLLAEFLLLLLKTFAFDGSEFLVPEDVMLSPKDKILF